MTRWHASYELRTQLRLMAAGLVAATVAKKLRVLEQGGLRCGLDTSG